MGLGVQGLNREPRGVGGSVPAARRAMLERKTRRYRGGHGGGGGWGGRTRRKDSERGGRWEGVAPGGIAGRLAGHNHRPSSRACCHKQNSSFRRRMRLRANELGRCKRRLRVNSCSLRAAREGSLGPDSGARPAGQLPAAASRGPASPLTPLVLLPLALGRERRGHPVAWSLEQML